MIKIESILIENFRGIRNLQIPLTGQNLVIRGPNGSGKSGIIDAIEFALTGTISRLTGVGSLDISVKSHAPHVDYKDTPEKCRVVLSISLVTGTTFSIERHVSNPSRVQVNPETDETKNAVKFMLTHPEFSLSRKEILKFILTEPGERAKEVQELLKLDSIGKIRATLQTASNSSAREEKAAETTHLKAKADLLSHLKLEEISKESLLQAVNERRALLSLSLLTDITADIKVSDGITSQQKDDKQKVSKTDSLKRLDAVDLQLEKPWGSSSPVIKAGLKAVSDVEKNAELFKSISLQKFFEEGSAKVEYDQCPLCDKEWNQQDLKEHLTRKIEKGRQANIAKASIEKAATETIQLLRNALPDFLLLQGNAKVLALADVEELLADGIQALRSAETVLSRPTENLAAVRSSFTGMLEILPRGTREALEKLRTELAKLPDLTAQEAAKQYLVLADERLRVFRSARTEHEIKKKIAKTAAQLLHHFAENSEKQLKTLYGEVEKEFARFYKTINQDDESGFSAKLLPDEGSLRFEVDFYGRGKFPPNAYHSEGHQDGMGLCLYLALSKSLLKENFLVCLLDDVLMSVDSSHRREVCKLLKTEFPTTQFVITTHDEVWSKQLKLEGMVSGKNLLHFRKWTVEDGPAAWDIGEIWSEIDRELEKSRVSEASGLLRRYLEFLMAELSFKLRATVEARPTASYELGDLMPAVGGRMKELFKKANSAANSWNQKEVIEKISSMSERFGALYAATNAEQWAVNASVHYNEWANLSVPDFTAVLKAFKELIGTLQCDTCKGWFYATPAKGQLDSFRCECGATSFNLRLKS